MESKAAGIGSRFRTNSKLRSWASASRRSLALLLHPARHHPRQLPPSVRWGALKKSTGLWRLVSFKAHCNDLCGLCSKELVKLLPGRRPETLRLSLRNTAYAQDPQLREASLRIVTLDGAKLHLKPYINLNNMIRCLLRKPRASPSASESPAACSSGCSLCGTPRLSGLQEFAELQPLFYLIYYWPEAILSNHFAERNIGNTLPWQQTGRFKTTLHVRRLVVSIIWMSRRPRAIASFEDPGVVRVLMRLQPRSSRLRLPEGLKENRKLCSAKRLIAQAIHIAQHCSEAKRTQVGHRGANFTDETGPTNSCRKNLI